MLTLAGVLADTNTTVERMLPIRWRWRSPR